MNPNDPNRRSGAKPAAKHAQAARLGSEPYGAHREGEVLSPTEARQASPKTMNMRVLVVSTLILAILGLALMSAYFGSAPEDGGITTGPATSVQPQQAPEAVSPAPGAASAPQSTPEQGVTQPPAGDAQPAQ